MSRRSREAAKADRQLQFLQSPTRIGCCQVCAILRLPPPVPTVSCGLTWNDICVIHLHADVGKRIVYVLRSDRNPARHSVGRRRTDCRREKMAVFLQPLVLPAVPPSQRHEGPERNLRVGDAPPPAPAHWTQATCDDYNMVMKSVGIADLKARLSEHLKEVQKGRALTVLDRRTPVARIVPYAAEPLEVRRATRRARDLTLPPPPSRPTDSLRVLLEDRDRR